MRLNLAGYKYLWYDGYGRLCLKTAQALLRGGHDVHPFDIDELDKPAWMQRARGLEFDRVTLQLMPPNKMRNLPGRSFGLTMHESLQLPKDWAEMVNQKVQWLIVPSPWLVDLFENAGVKVPIEVVKSGIDPDECAIVTPSRNRPYTFGCLADRGGRKGHQSVWSAFYKAFDFRNRDVRLIMKCRSTGLKKLDFSYSSDTRLTIWRADVESVADIYSQFDAFVYPTKCEGWGMPCRESAACGVPTVVTNWSGTQDETDKWAIPLNKFTMVESDMDDCGGLWAQSNEEELIYWMRWLYNHRDDAKAQALQGAQWLRDNRTYAQSADNLVRTMSKWLGGPLAPPDDVPDLKAIELTQAALAALPDEITGDEVEPDEVRANGHLKEAIPA